MSPAKEHQMRDIVQTKAIVTVAEMARMVGLSRARLYQLIQAGTFPPPLYDLTTRRPHYTEEMQLVCLDVRRRNCGVNGKPVLFYARGPRPSITAKPRGTNKTKSTSHVELVEGLAALGLTSTNDQVESALTVLYPTGTDKTDRGELIRA